MLEDDLKQPALRDWISFWALVSMQFAQAFNVNAAKFILMALGAWLIERQVAPKGVEHLVTVMLVLPYILFAPTCGWLSDRYAKSAVVRWTSWLQIGAMALTGWALHQGHLMWAIGGFFLIATQAALISPSKIGVVKEFVGGPRLGFASGVMEGTVILAILAGQIVGGRWFDARLGPETGGYEAAVVPFWWLVGFALLSVAMAHLVQRSAKHPSVELSWKLATSHARDLGELFGHRKLRLCGMGVGFFWGFGGFIALAVLQIAESMHGGGDKGTGTTFANLWMMAVIGIAVGSVVAGLVSRRHIEMGLAPFGGLLMTLGCFALAVTPADSIWQKLTLVVAGAGGAAFLVPLQAVLQDAPAEDRRGTVISASNLLNNLFGIATTALQFALKYTGVPIGGQFAILGLLALGVTVVAFRHLATDFVRLIGLGLVRTFYRIRVTGLENLPRTGGVLLLPNHVTYADAFFLSAACPRRIRFVMDEAFMKNPAVAAFCRLFQTVTIRTGSPRVALKETVEALQAGDVLCLFPEGQLTRTGALCPLQRGFEFIARLAKCPLVPVWNDGAWGSTFSFERGRFFNKRPYEIPYRLSVAFGKPLDPATADREQLRARLLETSAEAIAAHMEADANKHKPLTLIHHDILSPDAITRAWVNGYQIGQTHTLPRRGRFAWREGDPTASNLPGLSAAFPALYGSSLIAAGWFRPEMAEYWIGGAALRGSIAAAPEAPVVFFDFSPRSAAPFKRPGLTHCPCLAIDGIVVAMSMPDPPVERSTNLPQAGTKPGTWGKLLPGFYFRIDPNDIPRIHGPSAPKGGLALPIGTTLDDDGFLVPPRVFS
jgi:acyl-[acyl-carrier-protein]-phospholipid O-acyltransferase/long-chain-fatty-acid--[acyl-carrier-protein] ligase